MNTGFPAQLSQSARLRRLARSPTDIDAVLPSWSARGREPTEKAASEASLKALPQNRQKAEGDKVRPAASARALARLSTLPVLRKSFQARL